jgi:hypothetical protein
MWQEHSSRQAILAIRSSLKITPSSYSSCSFLRLLTIEITTPINALLPLYQLQKVQKTA